MASELAPIGALQTNADMALSHHVGESHSNVGCDHQGFGIARPKRPRPGDLLGEAKGRAGGGNRAVEQEIIGGGERRAGVGELRREKRLERLQLVLASENPAAMAWPPPEARSAPASRAARTMRADIDAGDGARRAATHAAFESRDEAPACRSVPSAGRR